MAKDDPHFRLRLPSDLKDRIEEASKASTRSINAEIVSRLTLSFEFDAAELKALHDDFERQEQELADFRDLARKLADKQDGLRETREILAEAALALRDTEILRSQTELLKQVLKRVLTEEELSPDLEFIATMLTDLSTGAKPVDISPDETTRLIDKLIASLDANVKTKARPLKLITPPPSVDPEP